jgi:hypothetical protein
MWMEQLSARLSKVERRLEANVPRIYFGTRKLFSQQYHLELAGFDSRQAWFSKWHGQLGQWRVGCCA